MNFQLCVLHSKNAYKSNLLTHVYCHVSKPYSTRASTFALYTKDGILDAVPLNS